MKFSEMSIKELKKMYESLHELIEEMGCYGVKDLMNRDSIKFELRERGYKLTLTPKWDKTLYIESNWGKNHE